MTFRTLALTLATSLLAAAPSAAAPSAAGALTPGDVLVDEADPTGDVNVFDGGGTKPTTAQRRTIDLERFTVTRTEGGIRVSFAIARVTGSRNFDQVVEMQLHRRGQDGFTFDVLANPMDKHATAYLTEGPEDSVCIADVRSSQRSDTVRVDVPVDCLPHGAGVLQVTTYTKKRNAGSEFSRDTMRVRGQVAVR